MQWEGEQGLFFAGLGPSGGGGVKRRQEETTTMDVSSGPGSGGAHLHQPAQTTMGGGGGGGGDRRQNPFEETRNPVDQNQKQRDFAARQNPFRESNDDDGGDDVEDPFAGCAPAAVAASRDDPFGAMVQGGGIENPSLPPMSLPSQSQSQTLAPNSNNERRNLLGGWMNFGGGGGGGGATSATTAEESSNVPSVVVPSGEGDFDEREILSKRSNILQRRIMKVHDPMNAGGSGAGGGAIATMMEEEAGEGDVDERRIMSKRSNVIRRRIGRVHDPTNAGDGGAIATMMAEEAGEGDVDERQIMSKRSNMIQRRIGRVHDPRNAGGGGAIATMMAEEGDTRTEAPSPQESMQQNNGGGGGNAPETDFLDFGGAQETREDRASGGGNETIVAANAGGGGFGGPLSSLRDEALASSMRHNPPATDNCGVANGDRPVSPRGEGDFDEREILSKRSNIIQRRITMRDPASHAGGAIAMMMAEAKDDDGGEGGDPFDTANGPKGRNRRKGRRRRPSLENLVPSPLVMKKKAPSARRLSDPALAGGSQSDVDYGDEDWLGNSSRDADGATANADAGPPDVMGEALPSNGNEQPQILRTAADPAVDPGDPDGTLANDDDERGAKKPNNKPKRLRPRKNFEKHIGRRVSFLSPGKEVGAGASRRDGVNDTAGRSENVNLDAVAAAAEDTGGGDSADLLGFDAAPENNNGGAPPQPTSSSQNDELLTLSMLDASAAADAAAAVAAAHIPEQRTEEPAGNRTEGDDASSALYGMHRRGSQPQSMSERRQLEAELDNAVGCFRNLAQFADATHVDDANAPSEEGEGTSVREDILNSNLLTDEEKRVLMQDADGDDLDDYRRNGDEDDDDSLEDLAAFGREPMEDCDRGEANASAPDAFERFDGERREGPRSGIPSPVLTEAGPLSNANIDLDPRAQDSSLLENDRTVPKDDEEYSDLLDFGLEEQGEGVGEGEGNGVGAGLWDGADADRRPPSENVISDAVDGSGAAMAIPSLPGPSNGFARNDVSAVDDLLDFGAMDGGNDAGQLDAGPARSSSLLEDFHGMEGSVGGLAAASASVRDDTTAGAAPGETADLAPPEADSGGDRDFVPKAAAAAEHVAEDEGARTNEKEEVEMDEEEAVSNSDSGTSRKASRWWGGRRSAAAKSSAAAAAAATAQSSAVPDSAAAAAAAAEDEAAEQQQPRGGGRFARRLFRRGRADSKANRDESAVSAHEGTSGEDGAGSASTGAAAAAAEEEVDDPLAYVPPATLMGAAEVASDNSPRVRRGSGGGTYVLEPVMEGSEYSTEFEDEGDVKMGATATFVNSLPGGVGARLDFGSHRRNEDGFDDDDEESRDADGTTESMSIATESRYPDQLLGTGDTFDNAADYEKVPLSDNGAAAMPDERAAQSQQREDSASSFETIPTKPERGVEQSSSSRSGDIEEGLGEEEQLYAETRDVDSGTGESRSRRQRRSLFGKKKFRSKKSAYKQIEGGEEIAGPVTAARVVTAADLTAAREETYRDAELGHEEITTSIIEGGKAKSLSAKKPSRWSKGKRIYCCCCILFNLAGAAASLGIIYGLPFFEDVIATVDVMLSGDTDLPTAAPSISAAPSMSPAPTATASWSPSTAPSVSPTVAPTAVPSSRTPTAGPSPSPTLSPTSSPVIMPSTRQPSAAPHSSSTSPSVDPTSYSEWPKPNIAPPLRHTSFPAAAPSQSPSSSPSDEREGPFSPTQEPSQSNATIPPTVNRTQQSPSQHPTSVSPTAHPSSSQPTPVPTASPTSAPTVTKSFAPDLWSLLGSALKGANEGDMFGYAVSVSADGTRLAVGSRRDSGGGVENRGSVTVLDYVEVAEEGGGLDGASATNGGGRWTEVAKLQGKARGDQFGSALSLSGDGKRLAVGAMGNDDGGDNSGKIQIYEQSRDVNGTWNVVAEFSGEAPGSLLGLSVSLDGAGTVLAAGAPDFGTDEESSRTGRVYVYAEDNDSDDGTWIRLGPPLDGTMHKELFGWSVSVARAQYGIVVAVGSPQDADRTDEHGHVSIFGFDTSFSNGEEEWISLNAEPFFRGNPGDRFGHSVSLSEDGMRVAIGSPGGGSGSAGGAIDDSTGLACVYEADERTNEWKQVGSDVHGNAPGDELGYAVALSADGFVLASGAPRHRASVNGDDDRVAGQVHVYEQRPSESRLENWVRSKEDVISGREGEDLGFSLAIAASSSDGIARIAAGAPDAGVVRVFV